MWVARKGYGEEYLHKSIMQSLCTSEYSMLTLPSDLAIAFWEN